MTFLVCNGLRCKLGRVELLWTLFVISTCVEPWYQNTICITTFTTPNEERQSWACSFENPSEHHLDSSSESHRWHIVYEFLLDGYILDMDIYPNLITHHKSWFMIFALTLCPFWGHFRSYNGLRQKKSMTYLSINELRQKKMCLLILRDDRLRTNI